jgi:hypothetical protein
MYQWNLRQSRFKFGQLRRFVSTEKDFVYPNIRADCRKSRVGQVGGVKSLGVGER